MTFQLDRRRLMQWLGLAPAAALVPPAPPAATAARPPVRVLFTRINGEYYYDAADAFTSLAIDAPLTLRREPDNPYDRRAIEILDAAGRKLGYLARIDNSAVARMLDAGERFEAGVARLTPPLDIRVVVD